MKRLGFKLGSYYFPKMLFVIVACLNFLACSSDDSVTSENEGKYAPETVSKKNFKFYKGNQDMWSFEVYFGEEVEIITSSSYFFVDDCDAYYEKTGENTAHFFSYYTAYTFISGNQIGVYAECDLQLTFLSAHHGSFTGKTYSKPESNGEPISGMFVYNSDKELDYFIDEEEGKEENINIKHLTENPWISTETDCTRIFSFDEKSKYKYYFENAEIVTEEEGKYVFNEKDNTLKLYTDSGYESFDFKVLKLSQSEAWLSLFDFIENKYPSTPELKLKAATEKDNIPPFISGEKIGFTISSPTIDDITANSAKIKGTIHTTGNENSAEMGVCYSKNETPTINDKTIKSSSTNISVNINNLEDNTTYYVRLYVIYKGKVQYGNITSFQTKPYTQIYYAEIMEVAYDSTSGENSASYMCKYIDGDGYASVKVCYGTKPNPTITDFVHETSASSRTSISQLKAGTTYYIRPYQIINGKVVYHKETSFETLGNNMKLSSEIAYNPKRVIIQYDINMEGTYELCLEFWEKKYWGGYSSKHLKYVEKSKGSLEFEIPDHFGRLYKAYQVCAKSIETNIEYSYGDEL